MTSDTPQKKPTQSLQVNPASAARAQRSGGAPACDDNAALLQSGEKAATMALLANQDTTIEESALMAAIDRFGSEADFQTQIIRRKCLPERIILRLLGLLGEARRQEMLSLHPIPREMGQGVIQFARHRPGWWQEHLASFRR